MNDLAVLRDALFFSVSSARWRRAEVLYEVLESRCTAALYRLEQLVQESVVTVPRRLIADAIDMIVFIAGRGLARRVDTIARVAGLDPDGCYAVLDLTPDHALEPQGE